MSERDLEFPREDVLMELFSRRTQDIPENADHRRSTTQRRAVSRREKSRIWNIFSADLEESRALVAPCDQPMECLYQSCKDMDFCAVCGASLMVMESGFPTCVNPECSIIYKITLDFSPEWRFFCESDKGAVNPARCGAPINSLLPESSFGCKILTTGKSSYEMHRIKKMTNWMSIPHREKLLYSEFQFIGAMALTAGIPQIFVDRAMAIHKDISKQKMFRGINRAGIKAASIYLSCRLNGCPRTAYEIADIFKLDKGSATAGCSTAVNILQNIERDLDFEQKSVLTAISPADFIERFCSKLDMPGDLTLLAKFIAIKVSLQNIICDNIPQAVSAGIV